MAQLASAPALKAGGREFESLCPCKADLYNTVILERLSGKANELDKTVYRRLLIVSQTYYGWDSMLLSSRVAP